MEIPRPAAPHASATSRGTSQSGERAAGLGISIYLSAVHATTSVPLYCSSTGLVNCERVVTSPSSYIVGIPVAYLGVAWFAAMFALLFAPAIDPVRLARVAWACAGVAVVLLLLYRELFVIGSICLWCTAVHVLTFIIFGVLMLAPPFSASKGFVTE